uniref:transmembrane protein 53-A n=1 Tax=Doryrhamphus excisus TaxID=161450 RepID=UPI0025AE954D|nr:transmembrane protein 53-A [Doryrhamphus excisus]XP_057931534.1 transmembrane protein 53-A [Doryrhamphus excisus]XP_057931535.1 transmembrane protein 53-A [Doryrhamphus excisus]
MLGRSVLSRSFSCHHLSKNVTFYVNEQAPATPAGSTQACDKHKPLTLMLPWLGARPQAVAKYCEIYLRTGFDVLVVESEVQEFLWPRWSLEHGKQLLELLLSDRFVSRPLLVHAFSIGGYTFSQLLVLVSEDPQKYQALTGRIKGQVYDSLVAGSVETMASGVAKIAFPRWETPVKQVSLVYFNIFKRQTTNYYTRSIDVFWNSPVTAPALFFYCENDPLSNPRALEDVIDFWRKRSIDLTVKKWEHSKHAGHLKTHPQEYLATLHSFIQSLHMVPLKAKM